MTRPADVLQQMLRSDSAKPRITTYDDTDGPTRGERIELSARVLGIWVNKAANALQDEFDIAPGSLVHLDLPPHWRTAYWALATWAVGGTVGLDAAPATAPDLLVTTDPDRAAASDSPAVLVTLAGLARSAGVPVPEGVMDEAKELSTHGDQFDAYDEPADSDTALVAGGERTAYADLVNSTAPQANSTERQHLTTTDTADFLRACLALWAADGSVVLSRGEAPADVLTERSRVEGATSA